MNIIDLENENHKLTDLNEHYKSYIEKYSMFDDQ